MLNSHVSPWSGKHLFRLLPNLQGKYDYYFISFFYFEFMLKQQNPDYIASPIHQLTTFEVYFEPKITHVSYC